MQLIRCERSSLSLALVMLAGMGGAVSAQMDPFNGQLTLSVREIVDENSPREIAVTFATPGDYPCADYTIITRQRRHIDTVAITLVGRVPEPMCDNASGAARGRLPLPLPHGTYVLAITRTRSTDRVSLVVSKSALTVRPLGQMTFLQPDTSVFHRPPARSFFVSCGTPNVPALCDDLGAWLTSQLGIVRLPLAASDSVGFLRYGGTWASDYRMYTYADRRALDRVRRCMRHVSDTLAQAVGVSITLQTVDGEYMRAWSRRSNSERHIPVPHFISKSRHCP